MFRELVIALALVGASGAVANAQGSRGDWLRLPSPEAFARYYPKEAASQGLAGRAMVSCQVNSQGRAVGCTVVEEAPVEHGFGAAAIQLVETSTRFPPRMEVGKPVGGGTIRIPINFGAPKTVAP